MPIQNEKFSLLVSDSSGNPLTGSLVELRKDAIIYTLTEVGNGWYSMNSIPTGKYSVFVDSVDTGETKAVGSGQVAALGNTADSVPVSDATEYSFQDPTTLKTTLSLNNVTNVAVPSPTGSDANKVVRVDSNGDYVLASVTASGFESVYEILTTADLTIALSDEYDSKLLVISREDFNFTNAQTFEVWGSCSIIVANTSEPFQWSSNAVNATFNLKSGADASLTGMFFLNGVIAFGDTSDYTLNIPWKVTNLDFISPEVSRSVNGSSTLTYELLKAAIPGSVTVTTAQDWWQNSAGDKLDTIVAGTNVTIDNTDPQNPIVNTVPSGSDTQIQFNDSGSFGGDTGLTYNKSTDSLTVLGGVNVGDVLNLSNTTNSPASAGDIWYDGTSVNLESSLSLTGTTKGIHGNGGDDEFLYITNRSDSLNGANIRLIDSTADGEYGQLRSYTTQVLDWYSNYIKSYVPIRFDAVTPGLSFNGELWYDGTNMRAYEGGVSGKIAYKNVDNNFSTDQTFQGDINAEQVLNLASYTNASPANGDIWNDGAKINIQAGLKVKRGNNSTSPALDVLNDANVSVLRFYSDADGDGQFIALTSAGSTIFNLDTDANNGYHVLLNGVQRLGSTANSTPVTGDIWHDSTSGAIEIQGDLKVNASNINFTGLPTSSAGLSAGDLWNDSGTLKIV